MTVAGVVLAAGASRRMGVAKTLLRVGAETFLDSLGGALQQGGCDPVMAVVAGPVDAVRQGCRLSGIDLVVNPAPSRGQISSLRCALRTAGTASGIVVLLVDQGCILPGTVQAVREALQRAPVVVARYRGQAGHPAAFGREVFPALLSEAADQGAGAVVAACRREGRLVEVDVEDPGVVRNLNTPEEYKAFQHHGGHGRS